MSHALLLSGSACDTLSAGGAMARVLVVDDEEGMREVCAETVSRLPGVEAVTEEDATRALERVKLT